VKEKQPVFTHKNVPYFSQWESKNLVEKIVNGEMSAREDPLWGISGTSTPEEYELWSRNMCGMACLKSVLKYGKNKDVPIAELGKKCQDYGGYITNGSEIDGLFYAPFIEFIKKEYELEGEVKKHLTIDGIVEELAAENFIIASVSHHIRNPSSTPPNKGGHLVLMLGYNLTEEKLRFHNPSGFSGVSQENTEISFRDFDKFFAKRGIVIKNPLK